MVTLEGAKKLLALCPKATFHIDLDVRTAKIVTVFNVFNQCCINFLVVIDGYCRRGVTPISTSA